LPSEKVVQRLADIIENADKVTRYVGGRDRNTFFADEKSLDAVERCLQRISEAAIKLAEEAERLMPDQNWKGIRGIGNPLRHEYDTIEEHLIWQAICGCPSLAKDCQKILNELKTG
jgi:uncharacterized protein with HEPN domain